MKPFVRNLWYPGAWAHDVRPQATLYRKIINEPLLFTRRDDGRPVVLTNVCPHRFAPLHLGHKECDRIRCGYHGLEFDLDGRCVRNPNAPGTIPTALKLRSYPVSEKHTMLWVWMGEQPPDERLIPDFSVLDGSGDGLSRQTSTFSMKVNVELVANNLMDLSHASFLHAGLIAVPEHADAEIKTTQHGQTVTCERWSRNAPVPKVFDLLFRRDGKNVDFWNTMRWNPPACFLLDVGCHAPGASPAEGAGYRGIHILAPATDTTTHYHVGIVRKQAREGDAEIEAEIARLRSHAFQNQDAPMLEAMQEMLGVEELLTRRPVLFSVDQGPVRMKRVLDELLARESGIAAHDAGATSA
jgi:phenylpropionate dioxygenase-like ring-hydroxylating dioxygenase large terminal subunit